MGEDDLQGKDLVELGEILRRTRESKGLSVEEVVKDTKIPRGHILAIESGNIEKLPGKVFARYFIKEYLNYIGLKELWPRYDALIALGENVEISQVLGTYTPPPKGFRAASKWWVYAILIVLLITSIGLLYARKEHVLDAMKHQDQVVSSDDSTKQATEVPRELIQGGLPSTVESKDLPLPSPSLPKDEGAQKPVEEPAKILEIKATRGNCWVRVFKGDKKVFEGTIKRDETKTFETKDEPLKVRFGNFPAVDIKWMGKTPEMSAKIKGTVPAMLIYQIDGKVVKVD